MRYFYKKIAEMADDIGEVMRKIRVNRNFSQEYVAEKAGVDYTTYSRYERGDTSPKFETIVALSNLYKLTLDEFMNFGNPDYQTAEPKATYSRQWSVPVTVTLDGTNETLETWVKRLTAINAAI